MAHEVRPAESLKPVPGSGEAHLSEGKGMTILPTDAAVQLKVGGVPSVPAQVTVPLVVVPAEDVAPAAPATPAAAPAPSE